MIKTRMSRTGITKTLLKTLITSALALAESQNSFANFYDMYRSDYPKGAFCSAIAGACASDNNAENSFFQNPASLESDEPDFAFDGDLNPSDNLEPGMKISDDVNDTTFMGGAAMAGKKWGYGFSFSGRLSTVKTQATLFDDQNQPQTLKTTTSSTTLFFNAPVAYRISSSWSVGLGLTAMYYTESLDVEGSPKSKTSAIDKFPQVGLTGGFLYQNGNNFRVGSWFRTPITFYVHQTINYQKFSNSIYIDEDIGLNYPWIWSNGISIMPWHDQKTFFLT